MIAVVNAKGFILKQSITDCLYDERGTVWIVFSKKIAAHDFVGYKISISHKNFLIGFC